MCMLLLQRSSSSAACLGFCLLKGHQSNVDQGKTSRLRHFSFTPLDTIHGQFKIEVDYAPASTVSFLEQSTVASQQPEIISDYVRGAQPADHVPRGPASMQGGLTASFQGTHRPTSMLNPASGLLCVHVYSAHVQPCSTPSMSLTHGLI